MTGQDIIINSADGDFSAFLATPESGHGPGVLVLQEILGVNAGMRSICDELAEAGFTALCPDLFWRMEPGVQLSDAVEADLQRAFGFFRRFDLEAGLKDIAISLAKLRSLDACGPKAGAIGYCLGGLLAYRTACHTDSEASVAYYGVGIDERIDEAAGLTHPLMLHIAGNDEFVPPEAQARIHQAFDANPLITLHDYAGKNHAFARPDGMHYAADAAPLANSRTLAFLHKHLD